MKGIIRLCLLFFVLSIVSSCTTGQTSSVSAINPDASVNQSVHQLEASLSDARTRNIDVLSPGLFQKAQASFAKAKQALEKGAKLSAINDYVADGSANLRKAEEIAKVSQTILGAVNGDRDKALKVGAEKLGKPYVDVENQYLKLTQAIENDNLSYAQNHAAEVQSGFRKLEIMAIKNNALGKTRKMMDDARKAKLNKIAPMSYSAAEQALKQAEAYAERNPYAAEEISQKNVNAEFMARRLMAISESSKKFQSMTPEASALYMEASLGQLGDTLNTGDIRDKGLETQLSTLTAAVQTLKQTKQSLENENSSYRTQIASLEQNLAGVEGYSREQEAVKRKLSAEKEFNEQFNTVQGFFNPDEAEVYKQGDHLIIRLRGIKFPVGQAILTPENYTLLGKVQKTIQVFSQPNVLIEGHTDSTGSAQTNQELSQKRAEAVQAYLVANKTLPENYIQAKGFGPDRPLAPNTTPEGRAINRRIDVLVTPTQAPQN
ncbi:OmpA family protein [uncultured Desulfobacter sp.]|uniref:OmpA family protein n=1 Tax=uncultured Desulfobacter sp. TaxID=240139 RepID=UPI002AAB2DE8|nr:OmpA family protein [uncultured Desulfobacter sp.]